ncbi:MAG TPA: type VII secretion system-associated protein [Amycolatopsis sp.]|nr:type VII secretion system-associated protein [Amycolatopsis sp.]
MADDGAEPADQWVLLVDPAWRPGDDDEGSDPPPEAVVGGWYVEEDGTTGRFSANPDYVPSGPDSPTDPVDAAVRLVTKGDAGTDEMFSAMREVVLGLAVDADENPVIAPSPDDVPSLLVTTAPARRAGITVDGWVEVLAAQLAAALPDEGPDVLLNPGSAVSMRVQASALKNAFIDSE